MNTTDPPRPKPISVSEVTYWIKTVLETQFRQIAVRGEICNLRMQSSGHLYFSLKDTGAHLSAVLFKLDVAKLVQLPKDGDQVVAIGELNVYPPKGSYQLIARELQIMGVGELLLKLQQYKEIFSRRGWFDPRHKKPLPKVPRRIGVITSPTGSVIQDIINVLERRFKNFNLLLSPVKVQGDGAALEIAQAIWDFNQYKLADVIIVGRGGGSIEDLWAFNEEIVVQAIFESKIPIISAIGHETDHTLSDYVSDVRAPTPSAAAEIAIAEKSNLLKFLVQSSAFLRQKMLAQLMEKKQKLATMERRSFFACPYNLLAPTIQRLDDLHLELDQSVNRRITQTKMRLESLHKQLITANPIQKIADWKARLKNFPDRLSEGARKVVHQKKKQLEQIEDHLRSIHPRKLLEKGYAILFSENDNSVILSTEKVAPKQPIRAMLQDGWLKATVETVDHGPARRDPLL